MMNLAHLSREMQYLCSVSWMKLVCLYELIHFVFFRFYRFLFLHTNSCQLQVVYFISISSLGFGLLKCLKPRTDGLFNPGSLDLFFTSVSAATVASMSTVEMEVFSDAQLVVLMALMLVGGEVFASMLGLHLKKRKLRMLLKTEDKVASVGSPQGFVDNAVVDRIELGLTQKPPALGPDDHEYLQYLSIQFLGTAVLVYQAVVQLLGVSMVSIYLRVVSSARDILRRKGLDELTFSVFITVSTFAGCGFVPTNENMMVFSKNSTLLLILIPQVLLGNTLFPSCLRLCLWVFDKFTNKAETTYLLRNSSTIRYHHLLPKLHSQLLVATVFGLIGLQFVMFSIMEWNAAAFTGLNLYEKMVAALFQCVNSRHTGENVVDLSAIAPAILVLFTVMMYLPPYTSFIPIRSHEAERRATKRQGRTIENLIFSQLCYLIIFIFMICITEREKMKEDPLNFNVFNIVIEVISAYRNVGYTTGYSCKRQLKREASCTDKYVGFSSRWSDQGKVILIIIMIVGRLKKFNLSNGGRGWKLL